MSWNNPRHSGIDMIARPLFCWYACKSQRYLPTEFIWNWVIDDWLEHMFLWGVEFIICVLQIEPNRMNEYHTKYFM